MLQRIRISRADFWVSSHDRLSDFYTSAWQRGGSPVPMLVVRLLLAAAAVGFLAWSLTSGQSGPSPFWLIYLTNWGLVLVAAMTLSGLCVSATVACKKIHEEARTPWYVGLYWVIFNVTQTVAIAITVLYWTLLYNPSTIVYPTRATFWLDVATHGLNSALTVAELAAGRTPVRWLHVYQPLCLAAVYVCFSGIYFAAGGTTGRGDPYIYPVLDWRSPRGAGAAAGGALAGALAVFAALWAAARARDRVSAALLRARAAYPPPTLDKS